MCLMSVVNGGHLVKPFDWLSLQCGKVYHLLKTLLAQVVHLSKYFHSAIVLYTYQYSQLIKRSTRLSLNTLLSHNLACMSVHYERKMHVLIIRKLNCHILISLKYELYKIFYTKIFQIYGKLWLVCPKHVYINYVNESFISMYVSK